MTVHRPPSCFNQQLLFHVLLFTRAVCIGALDGSITVVRYHWSSCCVRLVGGLCDLLTHDASR